ncbi:hypothetical protein [Prochlorococcus marinus]|uniref:Uncharacterized protein n=1 Tax=Prochlorococcus marinus XMU1408 TaxID=2213228 RepID=A0A318R2X9_PROMR|nr:hypothetical protein [Prochlorococcus marinus]MBW3041427.1 hypothetical protein [Prochlorococcus marinus str. XMU1408]PYE02590.1 hypothetical protein DNJ73_02220 [Prochlorococcus marinus XMU1408]
MKLPTISLKKTLEVTMNDASKRLMELDGLDKKALKEEYKEWIQASEGSKEQPHVLYANQINIEQL